MQKSVLTALCLCTTLVYAQDRRSADAYPNRPIRLIVPFAAGGGTDLIARVLAQRVSSVIGQSVVVDNRGGASGTIGTEMGVRAPPDGYTLTLVSATYATSAALLELPYDPIRDITPVILIGESPFVVAVHPSVSANNIQELVALAKAKPKSLSYGSTGTGGITHLATELFDAIAGTQMVQVPYKGTSPALNDLIGGQIQLMFGTAPSTLPHVRSKRLRGLAVTSAKRSPSLPELPTVAEAGVPGYEAVTWYAVFGPKGLPKPIVARWNTELASAMALPDIKAKFAAEAIDPVGGAPQVLSAALARDIPKWRQVVKRANVKATP